MKTTTFAAALLLASTALACDEHKYDAILAEAPRRPAVPLPAPAPSAAASAAAPTWKKRNAADCKPHTVDFGDDTALEAEVRRKLAETAAR